MLNKCRYILLILIGSLLSIATIHANELIETNRQAYEAAITRHGKFAPETRQLRRRLIVSLEINGRFAECIPYLQDRIEYLHSINAPEGKVEFTEFRIRRFQKFVDLQRQYQTMLESNGKQHADTQNVREELTTELLDAHYFKQALPYLKESFAYYQQQQEMDRVTETEFKLGQTLVFLSWYNEAIPHLQSAYEHRLELSGKGSPKTDNIRFYLANSFLWAGKINEAIPLLEESRRFREDHYPETSGKVAGVQGKLAYAYFKAGKGSNTEKLILDSINVTKKITKEAARKITNSLRLNLGHYYRSVGRLADSERILLKAYTQTTSDTGKHHVAVYRIVQELGNTLLAQGRYDEAQKLLKEYIEAGTDVIGQNSTIVINSMLTLAQSYLDQGKLSQAESLLHNGYELTQGAGEDLAFAHAQLSLHLARCMLEKHNHGDAERYLKESADYVSEYKGTSEFKAMHLMQSGRLYLETGKYQKASEQLQQAVELYNQTPLNLSNDASLAQAYYAQSKAKLGAHQEAASLFQKAMMMRRVRLAEDIHNNAFVQREYTEQDIRISNEYLSLLISASKNKTLGNIDPVEESFRVADETRSRKLQSAFLGMTARAAARNETLAELVRKEQDLRTQLAGADSDVINEIKDVTHAHGAFGRHVTQLSINRSKHLRSELKKVNQELQQQFPEYASLVNPKPVNIADVQSVLTDNEVLLSYFIQPDGSALWVIGKHVATLHKIDINAEELAKHIRRLRLSLDVRANTVDQVPKYHVVLANYLYEKLVSPAGKMLGKAKHVIIVPHGPLFNLPFGALVTKKINPVEPQQGAVPFTEYQKVPWFANSHAISVSPSATALFAQRKYAKQKDTPYPFIGFGNPRFSSTTDHTDSKLNQRGVALAQRAAIDDKEFESLPPLPETADEIKEIATTLGAQIDRDVYLGDRANETSVKHATLGDYKVITFATHGLVPGDLTGLQQPALALSKPNQDSDDNDGLLKMEEVLELKLNADWVVLSACNTAAGDGSLNSGGLTGLTRAFMYAGSKALLVSLWAVESTSTRLLTTTLFDASRNNENLSRAAALAKARQRLIHGKGYEENGKEVHSYAHPMFWAAFILVGDGG